MLFYVLPLWLLLPYTAAGQAAEGLLQADSGRYEFVHTSLAPGVTKALLYERLQSFVVDDLDAADTRTLWDEGGRDSIRTIAFIDLGSSPEVSHQMVDCRAHLAIDDGQAVLRLSGFHFSGTQFGTSREYSTPLHRLGMLPADARLWAMAALTETLRQLMELMDAKANGR